MKIRLRDALLDLLQREGIRHVFGVTGSHVCAIYEGLKRGDVVQVLNKEEGNAVYMADGYARVTKKPSFLIATSGPGITNMITGLATALVEGVPLVVTT